MKILKTIGLGLLFIGVMFSQDLHKYNSIEVDNIQRDLTTGARVGITQMERAILDGYHFYYETNLTLGSGDSVIVALITPNTTEEIHMTWNIGSTLAMETWLFEGGNTDSLSGGSLITDFNNNRQSSDTSSVTLRSGVSFVSGLNADGWGNMGTLISNPAWGSNKVGGGHEKDDMLVLKSNTIYVRVIKSGAASNIIWLNPKWEEKIPRNTD